MNTPDRIVITGLGNFLADRLAQRLLESCPSVRVMAAGFRVPTALRGRINLCPIDLGEDSSGEALADFCRNQEVDVLAHLVFEPAPGETFSGGPDWLFRAAENVAVAMAGSSVSRLVVSSSTMLYGARPENPNFCSEEHPLRGHRDSPWLRDQCRAEESILRMAVRHPERDISILRHCWVSSPGCFDPIAQYFASDVVPTPLGRDPLLQFVHEQDLLDAYLRAVLESHPGVFNVVGEGVLPVSRLLALAGKRGLPLPTRLLRATPRAPSLGFGDESPDSFFDFLRYLFVADGTRGWREFGKPHYTTKEAWIAFVSSRRPLHSVVS